MAGRRQHHLPQFLLAGFASRSSGDAVYICLFQHGQKPCEPNITNVGVGKDFYGPSEDGLDAAITAIEPRFADIIGRVRQGRALDVDAADLAALAAHLTARSRHLRDLLLDGFQHMSRGMREAFSDPATSTRLVLAHLNEKPAEFLDAALQRSGHPRFASLPPQLQRLALRQAEEFLRKAVEESLDEYVERFFRTLDEQHLTPAAMKERHNSVLSEKITEIGQGRFKDLQWDIRIRAGESLVLGDCGPIVFQARDGHFRSALEFDKETDLLLLPVSHEHLLVGSAAVSAVPPPTEAINRASSGWSLAFFVARQNTPTERSYQRFIGNDVRAWIQHLVGSTIPEIMSGT